MRPKNTLVIGAGVSGLSNALSLRQAGHRVTIFCKESPEQPAHTSLHAYAMWWPVRDADDARVERWAQETYVRLRKLAELTETGVTMRRVISLKTEYEEPWFAKLKAFRHGKRAEIPIQYSDAHVIDTAPVIDPVVYLSWLRAQVLALGGKIEQREVADISAISSEFDVIVNCTALGARSLAGDESLYPSRLQVVTIPNHGFDRVVFDDSGPNSPACIVPHGGYIKLGAVYDEREESLAPDESLVADIIARCRRMAPDLQADLQDVLTVTRALRPERPSPRVEVEALGGGRILIHDYGHDGMGYILSLGIARTIAGYVGTTLADLTAAAGLIPHRAKLRPLA